MRSAPSSLMTSPFIIGFSIILCTNWPYSEGSPRRLGKGTILPSSFLTFSGNPISKGVRKSPESQLIIQTILGFILLSILPKWTSQETKAMFTLGSRAQYMSMIFAGHLFSSTHARIQARCPCPCTRALCLSTRYPVCEHSTILAPVLGHQKCEHSQRSLLQRI